MADRVDILVLNALKADAAILANSKEIRRQIRAKKDHWFHPDLVDIFMKLSASEAFWLTLEKVHHSRNLPFRIAANSTGEIEFEDLKSIVMLFSHIVDEKSSYTANDSIGVGNLSRYLGELFGLSEHTCDMLELAGLLHDLGKLRIPDEILNKSGKLTEREYFIVQRHAFDTHDILKDIKGFEDQACRYLVIDFGTSKSPK